MTSGTGTPPHPTQTWTDDGFASLSWGGIPGELEDLGFLTARAVQTLRDSMGDDLTPVDLVLQVCARGPAWLLRTALGEAEPDPQDVEIAARASEAFWAVSSTSSS